MSEPILFVPGMISDWRVFAPQITALGRDHSIHLPSFGTADSVREMAGRVLADAPEHFALAGHSMGGIVAMEMLRQAPERVVRIALISTTPLAETPSQAAWREPLIAQARSGALIEAAEKSLPPENFAPGPGRALALALLREMAVDFGADAFVAHSRALQRRRDAQKVLLKAKLPALVLCGAHDRVTPVKRHEAMAQLIPFSDLVVLDSAGHMPMIETPDEVTEALKTWLARPIMLR